MNARASGLIEMDRTETQLRESLLVAPDFFAADLSKLKTLHAKISDDFMNDCLSEGWPTIAAVQWDASNAAARLSRHCFSQPAFMHACLPIAEQAYRFGEISGVWFTDLYDAIMFFENKPQVFGTRIDWNAKLEASSWKLVDPSNVDVRREAFGLEPLATVFSGVMTEFGQKNQPPSNYQKYRADLKSWAQSCGWSLTAD